MRFGYTGAFGEVILGVRIQPWLLAVWRAHLACVLGRVVLPQEGGLKRNGQKRLC